MKKTIQTVSTCFLFFLLNSCAGIQYISIETLEPAQVTLPANIKSVAIVNNVAQQPNDIGHYTNSLEKNTPNKATASSDSIAIFYTEALAQFLNEENFFDKVVYYAKPLRTDNKFLEEVPITPEIMNQIKNITGIDAVISLDKLWTQTSVKEHFRQEGYILRQNERRDKLRLTRVLPHHGRQDTRNTIQRQPLLGKLRYSKLRCNLGLCSPNTRASHERFGNRSG